jgi:hypothetical protein
VTIFIDDSGQVSRGPRVLSRKSDG